MTRFKVDDVLNATYGLALMGVFLTPRTLSRRERLVRWLRRRLGLHVEPLRPRGAELIESFVPPLNEILHELSAGASAE